MRVHYVRRKYNSQKTNGRMEMKMRRIKTYLKTYFKGTKHINSRAYM